MYINGISESFAVSFECDTKILSPVSLCLVKWTIEDWIFVQRGLTRFFRC